MRAVVVFLSILFTMFASSAYAADDFCGTIAAIGPNKIDEYTIESGKFDVNGDGMPERVTRGYERGTMNRENFDIVDRSGAARQLDIPFFGHGGGYAARWIMRDGRAYLLTFARENARYLIGAFTVSRDYRLQQACAFETTAVRLPSALRERDAGICKATEAAPAAGSASLAGDRLRIDFDNDGKPDEIVRRSMNSTGGRGCQYDLMDVADASASRHRRELLYALQQRVEDVAVEGAFPYCSHRRLSWFSYGGQTYLLSRPLVGKGVEADYSEADRVDAVIDGVPRQICDAVYTITWKPVALPQERDR
jgi:hypothetical protein